MASTHTAGHYAWAAEHFATAGIAAFALDLRGRGQSDGTRFYVEAFADYVSDVANTVDLVRLRRPDLPVHLLGHSAGGVVAATCVLDNQAKLAGFICESFPFRLPAPGFALAAIKGLSYLAPRWPVLTLNTSDFSRDPKAVEALNDEPLIARETQPAYHGRSSMQAKPRATSTTPQ